ncbi:hypothetical protein [Anatilimnocola floriformis]|uniref:hypothetical protein n=1 Tax=Anatilimnocola floriformis TaxID=2948575 RepID=UPI0020C4128F|nr:hypothetical protein [Anatilimnocola floriformis]
MSVSEKDKERMRAYYANNKEQFRAYKVANRAKYNDYRKTRRRQCGYEPSHPNHKKGRHGSWQQRRLRFYALISQVKLMYGCMNPDCGWCKAFSAEQLDYHHIEPKSHCVSQMSGKPVTAVVAEINKCVVLCGNCHRRHHAGGLDLSGIERCNVDEEGRLVG